MVFCIAILKQKAHHIAHGESNPSRRRCSSRSDTLFNRIECKNASKNASQKVLFFLRSIVYKQVINIIHTLDLSRT